MVDARIERKHPINDVDEIVSIVSSLRFYKFAFPKKDNPSFPQEWNEMDGWIWMVVVRTWSRSLRQVFAFLARVGGMEE